MNNTMIVAVLITFLFTIVLGPIILPVLRKIKASQTVRKDGPESHLKKTGTPTMGAIIYLLAATASFFIFKKDFPEIVPIMLLTYAFSLIGFLDDFIKVVLKSSDGLKAWQKFGLQIIAAFVYAFYLWNANQGAFVSYVPFSFGKTVDFGIFGIPLCVFILVGTVNGSNFTDGVDGLEATVTSSLMVFFILASLKMSANIEILPCIFLGALLGFLMFNVNKATVFMGDTGSLALGGLVTGLAYYLHLELYLPLFALIYFAEVLSVIIQVLYFKATHGKRFFRMAPIHHHFELGGWSEAKVVAVFATITLMLSFVTLLLI